MTNDVNRMGLLALIVPLALFVCISYQLSGSISSEPGPVSSESKPGVQTQRQITGDVSNLLQGDRRDVNNNARSTPAPTLLGLTEADFTRHVSELDVQIKKKLASPGAHGFSIVIQKPFVVIGDEPSKVVQERAEDTVKWAVDRLKQDFFTKDPEQILDIWLFKDEASYEKHARLLFADTPSTPYGYYSPTHKALIMNISTGGGTLVHEIVHPFIEANFPACPPWLNEGLGSLYEQCGDVDGHIHGFTNWRLPGLQRAIEAKRVPSFKTLTEMDARAFYNDDKGTNYAQARYLCYYLQEKGVLRKFYQEFVTRQKEDPSGFKSLQKVLAKRDMQAFKIRWEKYVMGLRQGYAVTVE
jgi:hypothetical protein